MMMTTAAGMGSDLVCCRDCRHFTKDKAGSGLGIGACAEFNAYAAKRPTKVQIDQALIKLGNKAGCDVFWGGDLRDRRCEKFKAVKI